MKVPTGRRLWTGPQPFSQKCSDLDLSVTAPPLSVLTPTHRYAGTLSCPVQPAGAEDNLEYVRALYDFTGSDAEDLPFKKGEILIILEKPEEQWWSAKNKDGRVGMIPVNYVEKLARPAPLPAQPSQGSRNSNSYGIPEPSHALVHAYAQPQTPSPLQIGRAHV